VDRPSFLVLNDSDYPGWKVYVDGRRSHWITANYLFRGVLLSHGKHIVSFAYEPASFTIGAAISGAALLGLAGFVIWRKRSRISRVAEPHLVHQPAPF
jgi:LPXTG-motif cell wall-anchored protein